ncbi:MalY/PatB family protein [Faecalicatena contorta]|uniref:MalY/PatB family protein n=1 Tax=Lachnospiraceae TaxID=186803 RepID=UPI001F3050B5|nr:MalY/PatB family protein [Faecalicatena contorta]MCF2667933.1 pyridoxal phosphate-dependent aminotransferase [Faecalicatena contorta]
MSSVVYKKRKNTDAVKWDGLKKKFGQDDLIPLWVADMDFEAPDCVKEALKEYVDYGIYGYYQPPKGYKEAFIRWEETYHHYQVKREWIRFAPGVVPGINWLLHVLTKEEDGVIIMPPVYYPFRDAIVNNNRKLVESPLVRKEHRYVMDYEDFEQKIVDNNVKLFVFCTPHNPVGRVWEKQEIQKVLDICKKHKVYVLADEIHQDIVMKGHQQIPAASVGNYNEILVTLTAATKTFNLAGCQNSILVIPDERLRKLYDQYMTEIRITGGNAFGYIAVKSAYENGREWLEEVLDIIEENYHLMKETLERELPKVWIPELEGTYLMWIDLGAYIEPEEMEMVIQEECGLAVDYGAWFGSEGYDGFIRVNLATSRENIQKAAQNLVRVLKEKKGLRDSCLEK